MFMTGKYFLDTNFLVYCFSQDEAEKKQMCLKVLQDAKRSAQLVLSTQVINEFSAVMLGKFKQPPIQVKAIIDNLLLFEVVTIDANLIKDAIDIHTLHQISFWDSLIICGARAANCHTVLSEDMQHGKEIAGVTVINPFIQ